VRHHPIAAFALTLVFAPFAPGGCGSPPAPAQSPAPQPTASASIREPSAGVAGCPGQAGVRAAAASFRKEGRLIRARDELRKSLDLCGSDPEAHIALGEILTELGAYDEARTLLGSTIARAAPALQSAAARKLDAAAAAARARTTDHDRALESYREAMMADLAADHARARDRFLDAWAAWPERAEYLVDAGLSARRGGDLVAARTLFDRASALLESRNGPLSVRLEPLPVYGTSIHPTMSRDGKYLVVSSGDDVFVFDTRTRSVRTRFSDPAYPKPTAARLSPDNSVLAIGNGNQTLQIVDAATGKLLTTAKGHRDWLLDVAFRPDGGAVASTSGDGTVRVWEVPSGRPLLTLQGHGGPTRRVAFSPDGTMIASSSDDKTARIWSATDGKLLRTLVGHEATVRGLAFRPDGKLVATASDDKTVRTWEVDSGRELKVFRGHTAGVWRVAFRADGSRIASFGADNTAREWDAATGALLRTVRSSSPDKRSSAGDTTPREPDDALRLAALGSLPVLGMGGGAGAYTPVVVVDIFYRADGRLVAFDIDHGGAGLAVRLWDVDADRTLDSICSREKTASMLAISPDGKRMAQPFYAGTMRVWDLEGGSSHPLIRVSDRQLRAVAWIAGHSSLAVGDDAGNVFLVDPTGSSAPRAIGRHDAGVGAMGASGDGTTLVSVSAEGELKVWSLPEGKLMRRLPKTEARSYGPSALRADGKLLAVGRGLSGPSIVDTEAPKVIGSVKQELVAKLIAFGADGDVVQLGADGTLTVIDPATALVKRNAPGTGAFHFCEWIRAQNPQAPCIDGRSAPRIDPRMPVLVTVQASADLAASGSYEGGIDLWRPGRDGTLVRLVGTGDAAAAAAVTDRDVELFGEDAERLLGCGWGDVRMPFEVCEDKFEKSGLLAQVMKR